MSEQENFQLRCHHCSSWIGEAQQAMQLVGVFKSPRDRERIEGPRDTWRCKGCGWVNVFHPMNDTRQASSWRDVEIKT